MPKNYLSMSLFPHFSQEHKKKLMKMGTELTFNSKKYLFRRGDAGDSFYIIKRGYVTIGITSAKNQKITLNRISDGEFFGEVAIFDGGTRTADALVEAGAILLKINREDFLKFLKASPELHNMTLQILCKRLRWCTALLEDFVFCDTFRRLVSRLVIIAEKYGDTRDVLIEISQADLAKMLGASREVVNRNLQFLQDKHLIQVGRKKIIIMDVEKLKALKG
jgi:CRP/FNR family transcriptional regulator, cyclic AMP receptor protein